MYFLYLNREIFRVFYTIFFNTVSSAALEISPCRRMLRLNPGMLRLWHWQSDALITRLDLILLVTLIKNQRENPNSSTGN